MGEAESVSAHTRSGFSCLRKARLDWRFGIAIGLVAKATHHDLGKIAHCLIQTEHTPWYHIAILDDVDSAALRPLSIVQGDDQVSTLQSIGRAHFLVLSLDAGALVPARNHARFLGRQNDDFVDVTDEILRGLQSPDFACNRRADHSPPASQRPTPQ